MYIKRNLLFLFTLLSLASYGQKIDFSDGNYVPNSRTLKVRSTVIDTLKADSMFNAIKEPLIADYNAGLEKQRRSTS
jgi:hypothetical protein